MAPLVAEDSQAIQFTLTLRPDRCFGAVYCADILALRELGQELNVSVVHMNNEPVPSWFRVMCRLTAHCPEGFRPLSKDEFQPIPPEAQQ